MSMSHCDFPCEDEFFRVFSLLALQQPSGSLASSSLDALPFP
jgi:hypothetical protein